MVGAAVGHPAGVSHGLLSGRGVFRGSVLFAFYASFFSCVALWSFSLHWGEPRPDFRQLHFSILVFWSFRIFCFVVWLEGSCGLLLTVESSRVAAVLA